jgi:beta-glucosidase
MLRQSHLRPKGLCLIVTEHLDEWDALITAWLPGNKGQGVADVVFGNYHFTGRLSYTWPRSMEQVPVSTIGEGEESLFPFGCGLEAGE